MTRCIEARIRRRKKKKIVNVKKEQVWLIVIFMGWMAFTSLFFNTI